MIDFVQNTIDGVMIGSSYSLLAIGFTLIFGVMKRINLSYGPSIMLGAFVGTLLYLEFKAGLMLVAAATIVGAALTGMYVERVCFWAVRQGAALASMVSSFAIWMQIEEFVTVLAPNRTYPFPPLTEAAPLEFGPFFLRTEHLIMIGCACALMLALNAILYRTRFGLSVRAVSENPLAARYMGINISAAMFWAFALASAVGGVAGFLIAATDQQITPMFGMWATWKGMIAMMLGGMGSIPGAILGGLILGVVEAHSQWYLGTEYRDMAAYVLLFAVLVLRPGGLFAHAMAEREQAAMRRV